MPKSKVAKVTTILFKLILITGIICLFFIPKLYDLFKDIGIPIWKEHTVYYKIAFYLCYIICLSIIYILNLIFKNIYKDTPFKKTTEILLKIIAILFMLLSVIVLIKVIYIPTPLSFAIIIITFIISMCFYVLSQVFKVANSYKQEIDYTI